MLRRVGGGTLRCGPKLRMAPEPRPVERASAQVLSPPGQRQPSYLFVVRASPRIPATPPAQLSLPLRNSNNSPPSRSVNPLKELAAVCLGASEGVHSLHSYVTCNLLSQWDHRKPSPRIRSLSIAKANF